MNFADSPDEAEFRQRLRAWLADNVDDAARAAMAAPGSRAWLAPAKAWSRRLFDAGYVGLTWPRRYGGGDATVMRHVVFLEEMARAEAPEHVNVVGIGMAGPTLLAHGTEEQKERYLKPILTGEEIWCQGFSEPDAGSDLAALACRARRDGDAYVVTGQKVWSSFAHVADFCVLLARTGEPGQRHRGLTYFLLDMKAPGVEVRPLRQITGEAEFNEIFLTDVRIPADQVVGEVGDGWRIAITTLMNERVSIGIGLTGRLEVALRRLVRLARETRCGEGVVADDPSIREEIGRLYAELHALKAANYRSLAKFAETGTPGPEGSTPKIVWSEASRRLTRLTLEIQGTAALVTDGDGVVDGAAWQSQHFRGLANTIEGGTSEILRSTIAERVLGLPRSR